MNKQEIEAFVLQYNGIECVKARFKDNIQTPLQALIGCEMFGYLFYNQFEHIELRSIEDLTEEELQQVLKVEIVVQYPVSEELKQWDDDKALYGETMDYLRSIGVACGFRGYSVDQMINEGVLKLKEK